MAIRYSHARKDDAALEVTAGAPGSQERFLQQVVRVLQGAGHPVAVEVELAPMALDGFDEGGLAPASYRGNHGGVLAAHRSPFISI